MLHIGGSHVQAGMLSSAMRQGMRQLHPGIAGSGFFFPMRLAGTNQPANFSVLANGQWEVSAVRSLPTAHNGEWPVSQQRPKMPMPGSSLPLAKTRCVVLSDASGSSMYWVPVIFVPLYGTAAIFRTVVHHPHDIPNSFSPLTRSAP